jgi:hypothetical protein
MLQLKETSLPLVHFTISYFQSLFSRYPARPAISVNNDILAEFGLFIKLFSDSPLKALAGNAGSFTYWCCTHQHTL